MQEIADKPKSVDKEKTAWYKSIVSNKRLQNHRPNGQRDGSSDPRDADTRKPKKKN